MKEICLDELKKIEVGILTYIDDVCKTNGLRYSLSAGTLLGAVRHNGFIPWDDDIDIMMPRPDYDRFVDAVMKEDGKYKILSPKQEDYYYNFSKVVDSETTLEEINYQPISGMGVYLDVFPLEGMPSDADICKKHFNEISKLRKRINSFSFCKPKIRKNMIAYLKTLLLYSKNKHSTPLKYQKEYEKLVRKYDYNASEYIYMTGGIYGKREILPKSYFEIYEKVMFENREFMAIKEHNLYLTSLYNDYMKLPPKEKQVTHHNFVAQYK